MIVSMSVFAALPAATAAAPAKADLSWHPHVSVWIVFGAIALAFWWAITRIGPTKVPEGTPVITDRQRRWLIFGVGIAYVFSEYPIHDMSEKYLLLVHMIQHTVFTLVAPAAILLGTPEWLFRWVADRPVVRPIVRFLAHPVVALLVFNTLIAGTHWVRIVENSLHSELWHFSVHFVLFTSAMCMWMPVINRIPEYHVLTKPMKIVYLFLQSLVPMIPAAFLAFSSKAVYPTYAEAPRLIHGLSAVGDQQISAAIMKLGGATLLWCAMGYVFLEWWRDSQRGEADDMRLRPRARPVVVSSLTAAPATVSPTGVPAVPVPARVGREATGDREGDEVLTWEQVQAEFERIERAGPAGPPAPDAPDA